MSTGMAVFELHPVTDFFIDRPQKGHPSRHSHIYGDLFVGIYIRDGGDLVFAGNCRTWLCDGVSGKALGDCLGMAQEYSPRRDKLSTKRTLFPLYQYIKLLGYRVQAFFSVQRTKT